ncbi:signal peptide peptidase SppA [Myxococcota bacterium]|nr:signal peptide peptidase SppA [Myxococcota bacterium]
MTSLSAVALSVAALSTAVPLPVRLPADVDDVYALEYNPGGLGVMRGSELRLAFGRDLPVGDLGDPDAINGLGAFGALDLGALTLAGGYAADFVSNAHDPTRGVLGLGIGGPAFGAGVSWSSWQLTPSIERSTWNVGLVLRPSPWLSLAFAMQDVAESLAPRTYDLGLAVRPGTDRVLISTRWRKLQGQRLFGEEQSFAIRAEVEPVDGLFFGGGVNWVHDDGDAQLGLIAHLRLALENLTVGASIDDDTNNTAVATDVAIRGRATPSTLAPERVAVLELSGELVPDAKFNPLRGGFTRAPYGAVPLLLDALARADHVRGVFIRIEDLDVGWAKAEELRRLIFAIRAAQRRVDCLLSGSGDLEYFVASSCSSIMMAPAAQLSVDGIAANVMFFAEGLDKLGVDVAVVRRGAYKSAPEAFDRMKMTPEHREALGVYLDRVYATLVDGVAKARSLDRAEVERIVARGTVTATEAVALKLVDRAAYPDELEGELERLHGSKVQLARAVELVEPARLAWGGRPRIAIVHVDETIAGGDSKDLPIVGVTSGARTIIGALEAVRTDSDVKAVVLRVDSPGGEALASDLIARAVERLGEVKPVIVSFGDVAASGGYYVAAPARAIYAEPTTLTGSIGVFSIQASLDRMLAKLGIDAEAIERGPLSNAGSVVQPLSPEGRAVTERSIGTLYARFLGVVAKGRKKGVDDVRKIAEGRIWSGEAAKAAGLVDELGGFVDAIARAKRDAGLEADAPVELVTLPAGRTELPVPLRTAVDAVTGVLAPEIHAVRALEELVPHGVARLVGPVIAASGGDAGQQPLALLPFVVDVD